MIAFWAALPKWAQDLLKIIGIAFVVVITGKAIAEALKAEGARNQREKNERQRLEEQARVDQTRREITQENENARNEADEAVRDLPQYRATDELRQSDPAAARVVLGPDQGHGQ